tara:strand:- start:1033 stop:1758 length:726 start_codon:yes stop_codon:yes gene_type:complete
MKFFQQYKLVARAWRYRLIIDKAEIQYLLHNIKTNDRCIDIGAHKGAYTYWMSKCVGEKGEVYAFEPQPQLFKSFEGAIISSKILNIQLSQLGFSDTIGVNRLIVPNGQVSPSASFHLKKTDKDTTHEINTTTLDNFFTANNISEINFIKCDVEGHELEVFQGGENFFKINRPKILVESEARHCGEKKVNDFFSYMKDIDYCGYYFEDGSLKSIDNYNLFEFQIDPKRSTYINNFVFEPKQ